MSHLSYLRDSHPHLANNNAFIAARGDAAAEAYSTAVKNGQAHDQAGEIANETFYAGLLFSPYRTIVRILWRAENDKISKDIPVLKELVEAVWRKEDELKGLKTKLNNLERQIKLSLKPIEQTEGQSPEIESNNQLHSTPLKRTKSKQTVNG